MKESPKGTPEERVDRMNSIFDRLVLPIIIFTFVVFIIFGVVPKLSCSAEKPSDLNQSQTTAQPQDFYALRDLLLSDEDGLALFEAAGYTLMDNGEKGQVAYRTLDSGIMIIENLRDSNGNLYSAISLDSEENGTDTTIMLYSSSLFLVLAENGGTSVSAVFDNEQFTAAPSAADADQSAVLAVIDSTALADMLEQYKASTLSVVE